jgi:hypothetical protein
MYTGPVPPQVNKNYPMHTYELITCLVNGEQKRVIQDRYLKKFGYSRQRYISEFPGAPLKSFAASDAYRSSALSDNGRKTRSETMANLNLNNKEFNLKRKESLTEFYTSDRSIEYKQKKSELAKIQHKNGQSDYVKEYFKERYTGSEDQLNRSIRMTHRNPTACPKVREKIISTYIKNRTTGMHTSRFKKKQFKNTGLIYQSSYEKHFLEYCEIHGILHRVKNAHILTDNTYPLKFYEPDYIIDETYIVEIKSWWIEKIQEERTPGILKLKESLVISKGYNFLYIKDKNYDQLSALGLST